MTARPTQAERLRHWSEQHAMLMALGIGGALLDRAGALLAAIAAGSFLGLLLRFRGEWTPRGRFGAANTITLARVLGSGVLILGADQAGAWTAILAATMLLADGLDGWAARSFGDGSAFGELFDHEADAFFLLALCLALFLGHRLEGWILLPGALRYGFVLFMWLARPPQRRVAGNRYTRALGTGAVIALMLCLLPVGAACAPLAGVASFALVASFAFSTLALYRPSAGE